MNIASDTGNTLTSKEFKVFPVPKSLKYLKIKPTLETLNHTPDIDMDKPSMEKTKVTKSHMVIQNAMLSIKTKSIMATDDVENMATYNSATEEG